MGDDFYVTLDSEPVAVPQLRLLVGEWLKEAGVGGEDRRRVELAVSELVTNVVCHAYPNGNGRVAVEGSIDAGRVVLVVADQGSGFWLTSAGLGLQVVIGVTEELAVDRTDDTTRVSATFHLDG